MRQRISGGSIRPAAFISLALCLAPGVAAAAAQGERDPRPEVDPYTEGDPAAMEKAGYVSFGPFLWGDEHTNETIVETLGGVPLLWLETEHFRIGCSLEPYKLGDDRDEKKKLKAELGRLKKRLPGVKTKVRELDPWLRLHLYALRAEELWDQYLAAFGIDEAIFPSSPEDQARLSMGKGPYLGMSEKFTLLLVEKKSSLARYTETYLGQRVESSYRYYFTKTDSMFFGLSWENLEGSYSTDSALHFAVAYALAKNFTNGFRGYTHESPVWFNEGVARWFARPVDERYLLFTGDKDSYLRPEEDSFWERKVRARVGHEYYPSMTEMFAWQDSAELKFADHMILWSRIDFLMQEHPEAAHDLLFRIQEPMSWSAQQKEGALQGQFDAAWRQALRMDPEAFDEAWAAWVEKNYKKR